MTRAEFIDFVNASPNNLTLAKSLEDLGVNPYLSRFVLANEVFNKGGLAQVFDECDIEALFAELRDLRSIYTPDLNSALLTAKASLPALNDPHASPTLKELNEKELRRAEKLWRRKREGALDYVWGAIHRDPGAFYDRAKDVLESVEKPEAYSTPELATGRESVLYLSAVSSKAAGRTSVVWGPILLGNLFLAIGGQFGVPLLVRDVVVLIAFAAYAIVVWKVSREMNLRAVNAGLSASFGRRLFGFIPL